MNAAPQANSALLPTDQLESTRTPIDLVVGRGIEEARRVNRGFALSLAAEAFDGTQKSVTFGVQQVLPPADEWEKPVDFRAHEVEDVESLVAIAQKYSDNVRGLVLYTDEGAQLVLDETRDRGAREIVSLQFVKSPELMAWERLLESALEHRHLLQHLIVNQHTLDEAAIIDRMRVIRPSWTAKHDSDLRIEENVFGVVFKVNAGDELVKFPRTIPVNLPILEKDLGDSSLWARETVKLEVNLPTKPDQAVSFTLYAPTLGIAVRKRIDEELAKVRAALPDWTIVRGRHREKPRPIGQQKR